MKQDTFMLKTDALPTLILDNNFKQHLPQIASAVLLCLIEDQRREQGPLS